MLTCALIFIIFLCIAFLPMVLENLSSTDQLTEMGVRVEKPTK
jgi:hypothetical protein